jgi:hypothetical protein
MHDDNIHATSTSIHLFSISPQDNITSYQFPFTYFPEVVITLILTVYVSKVTLFIVTLPSADSSFSCNNQYNCAPLFAVFLAWFYIQGLVDLYSELLCIRCFVYKTYPTIFYGISPLAQFFFVIRVNMLFLNKTSNTVVPWVHMLNKRIINYSCSCHHSLFLATALPLLVVPPFADLPSTKPTPLLAVITNAVVTLALLV